MKTLWNEASRRELIERLGRLTPDAKPLWGKMNAPQMLAHLDSAMRMAKGELKTVSKNLPIRHAPLKQILVYWMPWPKGVPTAPELLGNEVGDWAAGIAEVREHVMYFATRDRNLPWPEHPAFGKMTSKAWGVLGYRHIDHHLRQFGK